MKDLVVLVYIKPVCFYILKALLKKIKKIISFFASKFFFKSFWYTDVKNKL